MTSRPTVGQRQPSQRSLSSTNVLQRPAPHRTLSQQFPSSSPTRRNNDGFVDLTLDGTDAPQGRYGTIPRMGGSRLRLEISEASHPDLVESPNPATGLTPNWRTPVTSGARSQHHFDVPTPSNFSPRALQEGGQNDSAIKPMPLPVRPKQHGPASTKKPRPVAGAVVKKDVRPKPYTLEVPAAAPRYPPNGHIDFFPWTGNHPEDQFSEPIIRGGYYDKSQMTPSESGTARPNIFPALKQKNGLQALSSIFTTVLAQRRAHGQITTSSTFKPPPRVTVTDTKREMWLKDLANPTISLRRLSRSIPHGIRGKVLLDQSLSKNIPIERAVWLAKCVGANELRSFRRKGVSGTFAMGGEAKWIRDFTVCVEQFLENLVGTCGEEEFRTKITYAIRLAAHFYAEHLLDREHYMEWLVSSLENSPQTKLPLWILVTQVYWKDLLQYRKYGRRLSAALLNHFAETANHPDQDILTPIVERLRELLKTLMASNPDSFVFPATWTKYREVIKSHLAPTDKSFQVVYEIIDRRSRRLSMPGPEKDNTPQQRLIQLLDSSLSGCFENDILKQCWKLDNDKATLLRVVLDWSTSLYRPGYAKIYIAARICRFWSRSDFDITAAILDFVASDACEQGRNKSSFYHLLCELARSEHFSVAMYLQWLVARGGIHDAMDVLPDGPCATRLLAELPTHNLLEALIPLHSTLLSRAGFFVDEEEERMRNCMAVINRSLPTMQANAVTEMDLDVVNVDDDINILIASLNRSSKSEIGLWLRHKVRVQMQQPNIPPRDNWDASPVKSNTSDITVTTFNQLRYYLELIEDYSMLADTLKLTASSNDIEVLASCADTINLHIKPLIAIGALSSLFDKLVTRMRVLAREQDGLPRAFLVSLSDLATRIPSQKVLAQQLSQELALSDRKTAVDACSPVSDHVATTQTSELDFVDEFEKILASGNSMDQATLDRLFHRVSEQLELSSAKSRQQQKEYAMLLARLRPFNCQYFDVLMSAWVARLLKLEERPSMMAVLGPLVALGCLSFSSIAASTKTVLEMESSMASSNSRTCQELVQLLLGPSDTTGAMDPEDIYRLRIKQKHTQMDCPEAVLTSLRQDLELSELAKPKGAALDTSVLIFGHDTFEVMQEYALLYPDMVVKALVLPLLKNGDSRAARVITTLIDKLLFRSQSNNEITTEAILDIANDLTLPFCQIKLESMFSGEDSVMAGTEDPRSGRLQAFDSAIEAAVNSGKTAWASIVPLLEVSIAQHLRRRSELQFLALFPSHKTASTFDFANMQSRLSHAANLLRIIDSTAYSVTTSQTTTGNTNIAQEILTTLNGVRLLLSGTQMMLIKETLISKWIPLLLTFITLHISEFEATKLGHEIRAKAILALSAILLDLQSLDLNTEAANDLVEQAYDLALHLVDDLPDEVRQQCIRSLHDTISSPQMHYLLSFQANPSEGLVLCHKEGTLSSGGEASKIGEKEKLTPFVLRRWEMLGEPTPNIGENDTSLNLTLFGARRG
ncbi:hypothetical protein HYFRA_00012962 [Hymenoscyphus fraxineus]|uniref:Mediator of RNA polymerase II transcription subunit 12 n=1 Tax=Hymenoscyphus fraxineus TaxID=746836 RepID=A0A9N9L440_9HELO|nr:hypothetical protein HYFRA_00012962 [Hymenoscyphus fraxineus]